MRGPAPDSDDDRRSAARAWYLALVMGLSLSAAMVSVLALASMAARSVVGAADGETWGLPLAVALVAVPAWAAHARMRWTEIRSVRMRGAAAWATRLYRYLAAYVLLVLLLTTATQLVGTLLSALIGRAEVATGGQWWEAAAASQAATVLVAWAALMAHWREAGLAIRDAALIGEDDRVTRLRAAFLGGSLMTALAMVAMGIAGAIADAGRMASGMSPGELGDWLDGVVGPPIALLPSAIAAWWLAATARREAAAVGQRQALAAHRLTTLLPSLVGLAFLSAGVVQLLESALLRSSGAPEVVLSAGNENSQVPWFAAQVLVGVALWLPAWHAVLEARGREPDLERTASASRGYLFLVVGVALVAAVPATIAILFRILVPLLGGVPSTPALQDLALPISALCAAVLVGGYHGRMLLGDVSSATRAPTPAAQSVASAPLVREAGTVDDVGGRAPVPEALETVELVLEIPDGADAAAVLASLQTLLPPGVQLRPRTAG